MDESITVERVRHGVVVGRAGADRDAAAFAAVLPPKRDRTVVVVGASAVDAVSRLDPWVVADLGEAVRGDLCVVAPNFGSMGQDGTLPPARLLADRLGVEVTAADGSPVGLADGSVFVPGRTAGWVSYRPGGRRTRVGARFPAPWWQHELPATFAEDVVEIPAGLWVRQSGTTPRPHDPLCRQVPDRDRMYVVLGAPGEQPPAAAAVAEVLRAMTDEGRDRAVLAWYGVASMGTQVAHELGAPVRAAHGVPGGAGPVYVDHAGNAGWRPFALESVYPPGRAPVLNRWIAPAPALGMIEPGSYRLVDGWRVDVVARGLVVRPESLRPDPAWVAETGPAAEILLAADGPVPPAVIVAFNQLVRGLPADARDRLRVVPVGLSAAAAVTGIEAAVHPLVTGSEPPKPLSTGGAAKPADDGPVEPPTGAVVVTAQGRVLPATPMLAVPADHHRSAAAADVRPEPVITAAGGIPTVAAAATAPGYQPMTPAPVAVAAPEPMAVSVAAAVPAVVAQASPPPTALPALTQSTSDIGVDSVAALLPGRETRRPATTQLPVTPVEVPADVRSTAEQRRAMRGMLGSRYDVATRAVTRLLSERPGLRSGDHAALLAELAVVRVFAEDPEAGYDPDFHVCLADGLRRLPTARAVVVRGIPVDTVLRPDMLIRLPAPVVAAPVLPARPVGPAEALIWTTTARRLDGLLEDGDTDDDHGRDVVLSGHTRLRVLAVEAGRVLLAEESTPREAALARLRAAAAVRIVASPPDDDQPTRTRWFGALPVAA